LRNKPLTPKGKKPPNPQRGNKKVKSKKPKTRNSPLENL